jgi:RluA family pseudouridine synthase
MLKNRTAGKAFPVLISAVGKGWLVMEKPAGLSVHNAPGKDLCSHAMAMIKKAPEALQRIILDPEFGLHPVHRLDKETSGLVLLAADPVSFRFLSQQFESHRVKKIYTAILHGFIEKNKDGNKYATWQWPLAKTAGGRQHPQGAGEKQPSRTNYRVLDHSDHYTLVEIEPLTGRKHQIRRHAKLAGHSVVGDNRYGSLRAAKYLKENHGFNRLALHTCAISFKPPDSNAVKTIKTTDMPQQMIDLFASDHKNRNEADNERSVP